MALNLLDLLTGISFPTSKEDLVSEAENKGAPEDVVERLRNLPDGQYSDPDEVRAALQDFGPTEVQKHLKGANYPASRDDLVSTAESNDAPDGMVEHLKNMPDKQYDGPHEVMSALKDS